MIQFTAIDDCTRLRVLKAYPRCNQKTAIQFLDYLSDPSSLEVVLREVLALSDEKLEEFQSLLDRTPPTAILPVVRTVTGRLEFLVALEKLVYDPSIAPAVLERAHLHKILEGEPWVFGEECALDASDQSLTRPED